MRKTVLRPLVAMALTFSLSGCGTFFHGGPIYGGVRSDCQRARDALDDTRYEPSERYGNLAVFLLDIPFSFLGDTLNLPLGVYRLFFPWGSYNYAMNEPLRSQP